MQQKSNAHLSAEKKDLFFLFISNKCPICNLFKMIAFAGKKNK